MRLKVNRLARVEGKVIFVENTIPGDEVDVLLQKNKKDWAEGIALHYHKYSDLRVEPFCQHFGVCGGCQWQMLALRATITIQTTTGYR